GREHPADQFVLAAGEVEGGAVVALRLGLVVGADHQHGDVGGARGRRRGGHLLLRCGAGRQVAQPGDDAAAEVAEVGDVGADHHGDLAGFGADLDQGVAAAGVGVPGLQDVGGGGGLLAGGDDLAVHFDPVHADAARADPVHAGLLQAEHGGDHGAAGAGVGDVQVHGGTGGLGGAGRFAVGAVELDGEAAEQGGVGVGQVAAVAAAAVHGEFDAVGQRGAQRLGGGGHALG